MPDAATRQTNRNAAIAELGLEPYILELELNGYAVVPPTVTGVSEEAIDQLTQLLLDKSEELVGCRFTVEEGAECELDYGGYKGIIERMSGVEPSQFQLMQLCTFDRAFRDLAVNPVAVALMRHMIGPHAARFSSHNCFIKWAGDGYGDSLGLHCDQGGIPQPWGRVALNANCNWCLTEYTLDNGAFACVPGSHLRSSHPVQPAAAREASPGGVSQGIVDRLPRSTLARRVSEEDAGAPRHHLQLLPPLGDSAAGRHSQSLPPGTRGRLRRSRDLQAACGIRTALPGAGAAGAEGGNRQSDLTADRVQSGPSAITLA